MTGKRLSGGPEPVQGLVSWWRRGIICTQLQDDKVVAGCDDLMEVAFITRGKCTRYGSMYGHASDMRLWLYECLGMEIYNVYGY